MNVLMTVLSLIGAVTTLIERGSVAMKDIQKLLEYVSVLGKQGENSLPEMERLLKQVRALATDGGPVPDYMWDEWEARHRIAHERLQALREGSDGQEGTA